MGEWRFDSFKRWEPGSHPTFSAGGPPEVLYDLAREIWNDTVLRNTEPVLLLMAGDAVGLLDVEFVVGVDATFRRDPVVRVRWFLASDPQARADAFSQAFFAWLERDALHGALFKNATLPWAERCRQEQLPAALELLALLEGPPELVPIPTATERDRMASALVARTTLALTQDTLEPALVWCSRGLGDWMDQGFHVLDVASKQPLGTAPVYECLAAELTSDLAGLAQGARDNGGGSFLVGLQRQPFYERVLLAAFPTLDLFDPTAALDMLRDTDVSTRDRMLTRLTPAFRERIQRIGGPCVAEGREVQGPGGALRFRRADLASFHELEGLNLPVPVVVAFSTLLLPADAAAILPADLSLWPAPTQAWFAATHLDAFLTRWRPMAETPAGALLAREVAALVPDAHALPIDLLWRADPEGLAGHYGATLAAFCEAVDPADLPQVPPTVVNADWWLAQADKVIAVLPEGLALLLPMLVQAEQPLSPRTCQVLWDAATPHQQEALHPWLAGRAPIPGVLQRTFHTWLASGVNAWLDQLGDPETQTLWWVLAAELEHDPGAPLMVRDPRALFWHYVAYRQHLGERFTPLPVGQRLASRLTRDAWRVLSTWPADKHLVPVLFDLWVHGPEGLLADVRPPPNLEPLAAQLIKTGALARPQSEAAWDGLGRRAESWRGALEWARLFNRDAAEALERFHGDEGVRDAAQRHGWDQVSVLDPRQGWAEALWEALVGLPDRDPRRTRLLGTLSPRLRDQVVRASAGALKPGWVGEDP